VKKLKNNFIKRFKVKSLFHLVFLSLFIFCTSAANANVAPGRVAVRAAVPTPAAVAAATAQGQAVATVAAVAVATEEPEIIQFTPTLNVSILFQDVDGAGGAGADTTTARRIREMWAEFNTDFMVSEQQWVAGTAAAVSTCESAMRTCMANACGENFANCANDSELEWGRRLERCGRDANCSGREARLFGQMMRNDRDTASALGNFNSVRNCANRYNQCILRECGGRSFSRCLSRNGGDAAIRACASIFNECRAMDNGLQTRTLEKFAALRSGAERNIAMWETELRNLLSQMEAECIRTGGMFDQRSLNCLFNVELHTRASEIQVPGGGTLLASRTLNAGTEFMCTPGFFGLDVTTHLENLANHARGQAAAVYGFAGAGVGTATGLVTSGAIGRATERHQAGQELREAEGDLTRAQQPVPQQPGQQPATPQQSGTGGNVEGGES